MSQKLNQVGRHRFNCGHPRLWVLIIYFGLINVHYSKNIGLFKVTSISIDSKIELTSVHGQLHVQDQHKLIKEHMGTKSFKDKATVSTHCPSTFYLGKMLITKGNQMNEYVPQTGMWKQDTIIKFPINSSYEH